MKIVFITGTMSGGGAERVISVLANYLSQKGYEVSIIGILGSSVEYELDLDVTYLGNNSTQSNKIRRVLNRFKFTRDVIKELNPDVIISFTTEINIYTLFARIGLNSRVIISERNDPHNDPPNKITRVIRRLIYWTSDSFVFQTPDAMNFFSSRIISKSVIIPNPLKIDLPNSFEGIRKKEFVTVARLSKQKNLKMLIDGFKKFSQENDEFVLRIYGEGPLREELHKYIKNNGLENSVYLMGFEKNVHKEILDAAAFILTSDYEGISNSMIESLAMGIPTICTDCPAGGAKLFIENSVNGILIPVGDVEALYMSMKRIINDAHLSNRLSRNSVLIKEKLSVTTIVERWEDEIKKRNESIKYE